MLATHCSTQRDGAKNQVHAFAVGGASPLEDELADRNICLGSPDPTRHHGRHPLLLLPFWLLLLLLPVPAPHFVKQESKICLEH